MTETDDNSGGFLQSWSRRKRAATQPQTPLATSDNPQTPDINPPQPPVPDVLAVDDDLIAALPSLDDITAGFDIKPFLATGVPPSLKNAALRKLWLASPLVRDYADPAVDYAWDWNAPGGVPGGGGALSDQSVAKMVKDLIGNRPDPATDKSEKETSIAEIDDAACDIGPADQTPDPLVSVRHTGASPAPASLQDTAAAPQEKNPTDPEIAPQRRHGGATPE